MPLLNQNKQGKAFAPVEAAPSPVAESSHPYPQMLLKCIIGAYADWISIILHSPQNP